jgi:hypothetical protein
VRPCLCAEFASQRGIAFSVDSMSRFLYPRHQRAKSACWRRLNDAVDVLRAPVRRPHVLLVTGNVSPTKALEVEVRLRFLFAHLENTLELRRARRASPLAYMRNTGLAAADAAAVPAFVSRHVRWVADLDYESNPLDGWALMDLGVALSRGTRRKSVAQARQKFVDHVQKLKVGGPRPVYLFGTGPSLQLAGQRSFSDGTVIVCNTIVRDPELWHHLRPTFLTAGDAIYHFGHTAHARAFRADALRRLQESDGRTLFVYPAQFDVIIRSEFREVQSSLVPIPYGEHTDISVDLTKRFSLPSLGNALNLLLPLGCTLSSDVRLWGFDGRAPSDTGFWANSNRHAYPELMQSIRDSHPAFFADLIPEGNEVQYVKDVHGDLLDERLTDAERRGFQFRMLHPSWTPTLQKRYCELRSDHE